LEIRPIDYDFGNVPIATDANKTFIIRDTGASPVALSPITITGPGAADYSIRNDNCSSQTLPAETGRCTFDVVINPSGSQRDAIIHIDSDDPGDPYFEVPVTGYGVDTVVPTGTIAINNGVEFSTSANVTLNLTCDDGAKGSGCSKVFVSNTGSPACAATGGYDYATTLPWTLSTGDGVKVVYIRYKDSQGNCSMGSSDDIKLDTHAPTGSVSINNGAAYTMSETVELTISSTDGTVPPASGVYQMCISNTTDCTAWEAYAVTRAWTLPAGDGDKTVYITFKDNLDQVSTRYSDSIRLDKTVPTCGIKINSDAAYTTSASVTLSLTPTDANGLAQMIFRNEADLDWTTLPYSSTKSWTLSTGEGGKTVYGKFKDNAGNESVECSDGITLDTKVPTGAVLINAGDEWTKLYNATLNLSCDDSGGTGCAKVIVSNIATPACSATGWVDYAATMPWTLSSGDGAKTVYLRYKDPAGNCSDGYSDTINLDTKSPTGSITIDNGSQYAKTPAVTLTLSATDGTGIGLDPLSMCLSNTSDPCTSWVAFAASKAWTLSTGDGTKTVYLSLRDKLGNTSQYSDTITLDTTLPTCGILIKGGAVFTNTTSVNLGLTSTDANGLSGMTIWNQSQTPVDYPYFLASRTWTLTTGDGVKQVCANFKDSAGNLSPDCCDTITLDATVPTGAIVINSGDAYTHAADVTLGLTCSGTGSGCLKMCLSNAALSGGSSCPAPGWVDFATTSDWTLTSGYGKKVVRVKYQDAAGNFSIISTDGITLDTTTPQVVSLSPTPMTTVKGKTQKFTAVYSDPDGFANLKTVDLLVSTDGGAANSIWVRYDRVKNKLYLFDDAGAEVKGGCAPKGAAKIENTQGILNCAQTTVGKSGNNVTVNWSITPKEAFASATAKKMFMQAGDISGLALGWVEKGAWTIIPANHLPTTGAVTPDTGVSLSCLPRLFTAVYSDADGFLNLRTVGIKINDPSDTGKKIRADYDRLLNKLYLYNDNGSARLASSCTPGFAAQMENEQAVLDCAQTSVTTSGNDLTVNWGLTVKSIFAAQSAYNYINTTAADNSRKSSGWSQKGDWIIDAANTCSWNIATVDGGAGLDVGLYTSITTDQNNKSHISYYDNTLTKRNLKYATNASGSWTASALDSDGDVGQYSSVAVDADAKVYISYYDAGVEVPKYATNASGTWQQYYPAGGAAGEGMYTSIGLDSGKNVHVSWYDYTLNDLKYTKCNTSGTCEPTATLDALGDVGQFSALAVDSFDKVHIAYFDNTQKCLKYVDNVSGWGTPACVDNGYVGQYASIARRSNGKTHIGYYDYTNRDLKYANNVTGQWGKQTIDAPAVESVNAGEGAAIAIDSYNKIHIAYYDATNGDLKYASNASGTWFITVVDSSGAGRYPSIAVDKNNKVHISYYDSANSVLKYADNVY
jgi:hypothetical protein